MKRDRRRGADDTSSATAEARAERLAAALRANLQRRKARARTLAADQVPENGTDAAAAKPRGAAAED